MSPPRAETPREAAAIYRRQHDAECLCEGCIAYDGATDEVEPTPASGLDAEAASLAFSALSEAIRTAALLRTESVTITAPLARYLAARLANPDTGP